MTSMEDDIDMTLGDRFRTEVSEFFGCGKAELVVLGAGKMASAMVDAFVNKEKSALNWQAKGYERACTINDYVKMELVSAKRIFLLGVKPQTRMKLFDSLVVSSNRPFDCVLVLSILAGVTHKNLVEELAFLGGVPIVRLVPNVPAMVGAGVTLLYSNDDNAAKVSTTLLESTGYVAHISESQINAAAALTGSGPAFVGLIVEGLCDGAVLAGLPRDDARSMALLMIKGTAELLLQSEEHPGQLKDSVCSAGGTSIAGVRALEAGGIRSALVEAIYATKKRADEIGNDK